MRLVLREGFDGVPSKGRQPAGCEAKGTALFGKESWVYGVGCGRCREGVVRQGQCGGGNTVD